MKIESMSVYLSDAKRKADDLQPKILTHLLRCCVSPDNPSINHWKREITTWMFTLASIKLKGSLRRLSIKEYEGSGLVFLEDDELMGWITHHDVEYLLPKGQELDLLKRRFSKISVMVNMVLLDVWSYSQGKSVSASDVKEILDKHFPSS